MQFRINVAKSSHYDEIGKAYVLVSRPQFHLLAQVLNSKHAHDDAAVLLSKSH